jgi:hypothetical protein
VFYGDAILNHEYNRKNSNKHPVNVDLVSSSIFRINRQGVRTKYVFEMFSVDVEFLETLS